MDALLLCLASGSKISHNITEKFVYSNTKINFDHDFDVSMIDTYYIVKEHVDSIVKKHVNYIMCNVLCSHIFTPEIKCVNTMCACIIFISHLQNSMVYPHLSI